MQYEMAVVGHIVLDFIGGDGQWHGPLLGGPCTYASLAARAIGARVAAVSKVGCDLGNERLSWLRAHGISTKYIRLTGSRTTCFRISYRNGSRTMKVTSVCDPIRIDDLASFPESRVIHIGPVINDVEPSAALRLTERDSLLSLDPQGYLRRLSSDGRVQAKSWNNSRLLKKIDVMKVAENELRAITGVTARKRPATVLSKLGPEIILFTKGAKGTVVWSKSGGSLHVPAYRTSVRDPTGAGDAFVGAFMTMWAKTGDLRSSAATGAAVASFVVTRYGPGSFGTRKEIKRRAESILDKIVRM